VGVRVELALISIIKWAVFIYYFNIQKLSLYI